MAMPVMTIRSAFDKVHLHDSESTDDSATEDLSRANRGEVVRIHTCGDDLKLLSGTDFGNECRVMNSDRPQRRGGPFLQQVNETQTKLPDGFELKYTGVNGLSRKVSLKHRVIRVNSAHSPDSCTWKIDIRDLIHKEKRFTMRNHHFDLFAAESNRLSRSGRGP